MYKRQVCVLLLSQTSCDSFLDRQEDEALTLDKVWETRAEMCIRDMSQGDSGNRRNGAFYHGYLLPASCGGRRGKREWELPFYLRKYDGKQMAFLQMCIRDRKSPYEAAPYFFQFGP